MVPRTVFFVLLLITSEAAAHATQIECDAVTTDLRNTSTTAADMCIIVLPDQKLNLSSMDLSSAILPKYDKFSIIGINGSFPLVDFFQTKSHVEKLLIYDSVMHEVGIPPSLKSLLLTQSQTRKIVIRGLVNYHYALENLIVVNNELRDIPLQFVLLRRLKSLNLAKNLIEKLNLLSLDGLKQLETIDLSSNHIHQIVIGTTDLPCLLKLDLSHNKLKRIPPKLGVLRSLEILILSNNKLEYIEMSYFNGLLKLNQLDLRFNNLLIGSLSPVFLPALEVLHLQSCHLQHLDFIGMEVPKLKKLHVEDNKLEYVEGFFNNAYHDAGLELFGDRNPWNCKWLQEKHSKIKIVIHPDRQACKRFVRNVCCVGNDYAADRKADRRWQVLQEQSRQVYYELKDQKNERIEMDKHYSDLKGILINIEHMLKELKVAVKNIAEKIELH